MHLGAATCKNRSSNIFVVLTQKGNFTSMGMTSKVWRKLQLNSFKSLVKNSKWPTKPKEYSRTGMLSLKWDNSENLKTCFGMM